MLISWRAFRLRRAVGAMVVCIVLVVAAYSEEPAEHDRNRELRQQILTMANLRTINTLIAEFRMDHGSRLPNSLDDLVEYVQKQRDIDGTVLTDGWGRRILFYTSGDHYVLASLGQDGIGSGHRPAPGGVLRETDYSDDFVIIDGAWAQSPANVDR